MAFGTTVVNGGLDLITAPQAVQPGRLLACSNYEVARVRGIRRMDGYEKYDGGQSPSTGNGILASVTIQTSIPAEGIAAGDSMHFTGFGTFGSQYGTIFLVDDVSDVYPIVYISLLEPLPYILSSGIGQPGFALFDDTTSNSFNILAAGAGAPGATMGPPSGVTLTAGTTQSGSLPNPATYGYVLTAVNANGETTPSAEATVTINFGTPSTTSGVIGSAVGTYQVHAHSIASYSLNQWIWIDDGIGNSLRAQIIDTNTIPPILITSAATAVITGTVAAIPASTTINWAAAVNLAWTNSAVPSGVPARTGTKVYGRTVGSETYIETRGGQTGTTAVDSGHIIPNDVRPPTANTTGTAQSVIDNLADNFTTISATVQQVPGQGNVNGVFWLNDILYATRDFFAVNFSTGTYEPDIGDTLYQGASLGAATWQGQVAKIVLTSGSWNSIGTGNAVGVIMFYNVLGTIASSTALNNDTKAQAAMATALSSGAGNAASTAAGLYVALGDRGSTIADESWQLCDLGWNLQYKNGVADFVDMNVALDQANAALNVQQYVTTPWKVATTGSISGTGWFADAGAYPTPGSWPDVVAAQNDGQYVWHNFADANAPKSGLFTLTGFGFTDIDIPANASIAGIEIQFTAGAIGGSGGSGYTANPIDKTFNLIGLASGQSFPLMSATVYPVTPSAGSITPIPGSLFSHYNFATRTLGTPTVRADTPTDLLGYNQITPVDVTNPAFGITYQVGLSGNQTNQEIQFGVDFVQIRFSYLPQTNQIYFWDGKSTSVTDGAMTAGSTALTSASTTFTSADIGKTVTVVGAGLQEEATVTDGVMSAASPGLTSASGKFTLAMQGDSITVGGAGAQSGSTLTDGVMTLGGFVLACTTSNPFTAADIGKAVTVTNAAAGPATLTAMIVGFTDTGHVTLGTACSHATSGATVKKYGTLTTTILTYNSATSVTLAANSTVAVSASTVNVYGLLTSSIKSITSTHVVALADAAAFTVSGATVTFYQPVLARVVMHYEQNGDISTSNAAGTLYFQFIQPDGTIGGLPVRPVGSDEHIRTLPTGGRAPDGGANDGSTLIADTATAAAINVMDWSALLQGQLQPDGTNAPPSKYQSVTDNFYASTGLNAIYGVSGGGPAFYYDGIKRLSNGNVTPGNFSRILTGLPLQFETPRSVVSHQGVIILGYYSGVIQWSNNQNVLSFDPTLNGQTAGNDGFGSRIMGMASINGDSLCVWTPSKVQMMQGNFNIPAGSQTTPSLYKSIISPTSGGIEYTIQPMANYMYCDFRGITAIGATQKYGDFELGHYSSDIAPFIIPRVQLSSFFEGPNTGIINSVLIRNKNMVRYFFADGTALSMTFLADNENPQFTIQNYVTGLGRMNMLPSGQPLTWDVVQAFTESLGRDRIFGATADGTGWVYELERANSFNGAAITAFATLVPDTAQTPYLNKEFKGINIFGQAQDYATFTLSRSADYVTVTQATADNVINGIFGSPTATPTGNIAAFLTYATSGLMIEGTAINLRFDSSSNEQFPHVIQAVSYTIDQAQEKQQ